LRYPDLTSWLGYADRQNLGLMVISHEVALIKRLCDQTVISSAAGFVIIL
jgi:ABC-type dipeptide/oligopeptide/nickel transport system ATPase subunit